MTGKETPYLQKFQESTKGEWGCVGEGQLYPTTPSAFSFSFSPFLNKIKGKENQ